MFGRATPHVCLQECRSRYEECDSVTRNQFTDRFCIERIGMKYNANPVDSRQPQGDGKPKRMEERQDAKHFVAAAEHKNLSDLADIGKNIVVRKHHALGITSTAAGKNDGCKIFSGR